jgi:hypothetical protein
MNAHDQSNLRVFYHNDPESTTKIVFIRVGEREMKITWVITLPARNSFSSLKTAKTGELPTAMAGVSASGGARRVRRRAPVNPRRRSVNVNASRPPVDGF